MSTFGPPFLLGFDEIENMLARITKTADGFPPYNIEQLTPDLLRITLAVAGYAEDDLDITIEDNQLMVRGRQNQNPDRKYLYRGIAGRSFIKTFVLADGMVIEGASLENGLLNIDLKKPVKTPQVKHIAIKTKSQPVLLGSGRRKK